MTYDRETLQAILARAAQLQHDAESSGETPPGLTLDEIKEAAAAAGIDAQYVTEAALSVSAPPGERPGLFGPPATFEATWQLEGQVDPSEFEVVRALIRQAMGLSFDTAAAPGRRTARAGEVFEWHHGPLDHITMQQEGAHVTLTARGRWASMAASLYLGVATAGAVAGLTLMAVTGSWAGAFAGGLIGTALGLVFGGLLWRRWHNKARARLTAAVRAAARHVAATSAVSSAGRARVHDEAAAGEEHRLGAPSAALNETEDREPPVRSAGRTRA